MHEGIEPQGEQEKTDLFEFLTLLGKIENMFLFVMHAKQGNYFFLYLPVASPLVLSALTKERV